MSVDIEDFNARWLAKWTEKDVPGLLAFYSADTIYRDPQVPDGLTGEEALGAYLKQLFDGTPPMHYEPHETWKTENGFCGRWYCTISAPDGTKSLMRGFDPVVLEGDRIKLNEVYVHNVTKIPG